MEENTTIESQMQGLSSNEAKQRLLQDGPNVLKKHQTKSVWKMFLDQFKDFMIILLLIAAVISFIVAIYNYFANGRITTANTIVDFVQPFIILIVVVLNSLLGTYQEIKSNQAVTALEKSNELNAKVIRDNQIMIIPSHEVVVGDLLVVEAGDAICADAKIIDSYTFSVVESALTGESQAVYKQALDNSNHHKLALGDRVNMIYSGTYVVSGKAYAVVTATGDKTELGKINSLVNEQEATLSPLQIKLNKLSKIFGISGVVLLFVSMILQIVLTNAFSGIWNKPEVYTNAMVIGISLAVAAIPEGLITFTTVLLAIGVSRMTKENVIIKAFSTVETFGSTNIICSDKTGTLTQNKMSVVEFYDVLKPQSDLENSMALGAFVACCDADVTVNEKNEYIEVGDATETGILRFGIENNNTSQMFFDKYQKLDSLPFDSTRKAMSILVKLNDKEQLIITKGAPDVILAKSINASEHEYQMVEKWSKQAYRVLAVAYKKVSNHSTISIEDENNLTCLGLIALMDPPRENVKQSILEAKQAGVKTIMITGDHLTTAVAIAKNLGIYNVKDVALTGSELATMSDEELREKVKHISVYARVTPTDKLRIVKAWQYHNQVVAMTGDGVNDAPALKAADLGCAMGITGTDVSKQAADVILTDDNFNTIVKGIKSGRETFDRIKSVILNLLVSSVVEIFVMMIGLFLFRFIFKDQISTSEFIILSAAQLLWINLLTHGLPAIALGMTPNDEDVMKRKPFNKYDSIFANGMGKKLMIHSLILTFFSLLSYLIVGLIAKANLIIGEDFVKLTSTACFITLGIGSSINALNLMSKNNIYRCGVTKYKLVYLASLSSFVLILFAAFIPGINTAFGMYDVLNNQYLAVYALVPIVLGFGLLIIEEFKKGIIAYKEIKASFE
ncbi:HAD-IC family P-type ATPase [Mycoplasma sp. NEAQ87857]|uniref:cation-translocating P-type ATPase n=1 Tax=Mycoplasma sp. NEAQ87857 TaxID=2683967 RepID=UPI001317C805|nr:cation-translocating P-type ATPase [Mycoplasma sp. NEAQ87857]QGZ97454.1 HAD-IC family P-type ATPase [Mycoplasma sp. NEAQ87857]